MLDRLISGAGALTDRADRLVRLFTSGRGPDVLANRPASVIVIILLIGTAIVARLLAIEATDNPTRRILDIQVHRERSAGSRPAFIRRDRAAGALIGESGLLIQGSVAGGAG